jgi:hypothetical protein
MKNIKLKFILSAILVSIFVLAVTLEDKIFETESIIIDKTMTKDALGSLQEELQEKDITLTFSEVTYNAKGFLESVKGEVNCLSASGNFSCNNLDKIVIVKGILGIEMKVTSERS